MRPAPGRVAGTRHARMPTLCGHNYPALARLPNLTSAPIHALTGTFLAQISQRTRSRMTLCLIIRTLGLRGEDAPSARRRRGKGADNIHTTVAFICGTVVSKRTKLAACFPLGQPRAAAAGTAAAAALATNRASGGGGGGKRESGGGSFASPCLCATKFVLTNGRGERADPQPLPPPPPPLSSSSSREILNKRRVYRE
jgi:hypothetical protein